MRTHQLSRLLALTISTLFLSQTAVAQSTAEASQLLAQGKAKEAYQLLLAEEAAHAGNPEFDYLLGRAALDAGENTKATLIFERVLVVAPNHAGARLDMGRAYFNLGDFPRAKSEFESLQALNPPPAAQSTIAQYLAAIEQRGKPNTTRITAYTELTLGRDGNVTAGPSSNSIYLPIFGLNFTLGQAARAQSDSYHQIGAGGEIIHPLDENNSVFVATDLRFRNYKTVDNYDQLSGDVRGGWIHASGANTYRLFASYGDLNLGNEGYRRTTSLGADWRHKLDQRNQLAFFAQTSQLRYVQDTMDAYDYDQYIAGATWMNHTGAPAGVLLAATLFAGYENEVRQRTDGNKNFFGVRGGLMLALAPTLDLYSGITLQHGKYQRENILFQTHRKDKQLDLMLGLNWKFSPGWTLRPQISRTQNHSNTALNTYRRTEGSLTLRKDF